ncbi:MAG: S8 family peptidase [Ignavibacteria bacterium]|nr:S8 family peptidase [Ignavibacteria bacterium]
MNKILVLFLVAGLCLPLCLMAQKTAGMPPNVSAKIDAKLKLLIFEQNLQKQSKKTSVVDPKIKVIFRTTSTNIADLVVKHNGKLHSVIGQICTAEFPISTITAFAAEPEIIKIQSSQKVTRLNDKAKVNIGAVNVHSGMLPNGTPYTGKGILIGFVDTGIDFLHPDFRKKGDTTHTRIVYIWDQNDTINMKPKNFNYGAEWSQANVNSEISLPGIINQHDSIGHGTHVAGSAAGLRGIAPEADICMVSLKNDDDGAVHMLDGINYLYQKAIELNVPCVVNLSVGTNDGSAHDGNDLIELGIESMTNQRNGFVVCAAAGNEGTNRSHNGGYKLGNDTSWFYCNTFDDFELYHTNKSMYDDSIWVSVCMDSLAMNFTDEEIISQSQVYQSPWMQIKDLKQLSGGKIFDVAYGNGESAGQVIFVASSLDSTTTDMYISTYNLIPFDKKPLNSRTNIFRILYKGSGIFHTWSGGDAMLSSYNSRKDSKIRDYDNKYTILIPGTGRKVLCVGAYNNKKSYINLLGKEIVGTTEGVLANFTSIGPTTDGRIKPDFGAPGQNVASSKSRYSSIAPFMMTDDNTIVYQGSSMACPMAAGAVALYLERSPNATFEQVKDAIISTTDKDSLTNLYGALPNNRWGNGRLNIFKAMGGVTYVNEEQGDKDIGSTLAVFPNPTASVVTFTFSEVHGSEKLTVFDINGKSVSETHMKDSQHQLDVSAWTKGIYTFQITGKGQRFSGKFVVE